MSHSKLLFGLSASNTNTRPISVVQIHALNNHAGKIAGNFLEELTFWQISKRDHNKAARRSARPRVTFEWRGGDADEVTHSDTHKRRT
jgi:hypothetical protein